MNKDKYEASKQLTFSKTSNPSTPKQTLTKKPDTREMRSLYPAPDSAYTFILYLPASKLR